jgi:hypothetical protein
MALFDWIEGFYNPHRLPTRRSAISPRSSTSAARVPDDIAA